jgi:hypothetical protein
MNRKIAVAAIVGGLMHTMSLLRGQEPQPVTRTPGPPLPRDPSATTLSGEVPVAQDTSLTPAVVEDLQRQVAELTRRVDLMERAFANTVGFTKVGNDFVFEPSAGNVFIKAPMELTIQGGTNVKLAAGTVLEQKAATIKLN